MSCVDCYRKIKVRESSAGEVEVVNCCVIDPHVFTIDEVLSKKGCPLGDAKRKATDPNKHVAGTVPFRVVFNTKLYKIQKRDGKEWVDMTYNYITSHEPPVNDKRVLQHKDRDAAIRMFNALKENYLYEQNKDNWVQVDLD